MSRTKWRHKLYRRLFDVHTPSGRYLSGFWILTALVSVALLFLESGMPQAPHQLGLPNNTYQIFEVIFTLLFTVEYGLRLFTSIKPWRYIFSFFGIIDLVTLLPLYILWLWPEIALQYVTAMRLLRVLRLLRVVKILRYIDSVSVLWQTLLIARKKLLIFFGIVMILLCLFGGMMYVIEGPQHGFINLPVSVYWAVVTMTTVGYGDITPHTPLGRVLTSLLILLGYSIIAIPIGVMSAYMTEVMQQQRIRRYCTGCGARGHDDDARYCKQCGTPLRSTGKLTNRADS